MTKLSNVLAETVSDRELDSVTGGASPQLATASAWVVQPEFRSVFSRYVLGQYGKQPE
jgi:hypothetical protein